MASIDQEQYIVNDRDRVKTALHIDHKPRELKVELINTGGENMDTGFCRVTPLPTGIYRDGLEVSNTLLQELLEEEAIEKIEK